jgi:DNA-binding CsgD family transcriptional regulator
MASRQESVQKAMPAACEMNISDLMSMVQEDFGLTSRERQLVGLVSAGYSNKELAHNLGISENTVKHHITSIFDKLGVINRLELVLFALHRGLTVQA